MGSNMTQIQALVSPTISLIIRVGERKFHAIFALGSESSRGRKFHPWNFRSWERKYVGTKVPVTKPTNELGLWIKSVCMLLSPKSSFVTPKADTYFTIPLGTLVRVCSTCPGPVLLAIITQLPVVRVYPAYSPTAVGMLPLVTRVTRPCNFRTVVCPCAQCCWIYFGLLILTTDYDGRHPLLLMLEADGENQITWKCSDWLKSNMMMMRLWCLKEQITTVWHKAP